MRTADPEIVKNRRGNNWNPRRRHLESNLVLFEKTAHPTRCFEPEGAAAREDQRVDGGRDVHRVEYADFSGATGTTAYINSGRSASFTQDHRAAGDTIKVCCVSHADADNRCKTVHERYTSIKALHHLGGQAGCSITLKAQYKPFRTFYISVPAA